MYNGPDSVYPDLKNKKSLTSFLRITLSPYGETFVQPATPVSLLVPGVYTPPYGHRFKSLLYIKTLVIWIITNLYHLSPFNLQQ